MEYIVGMTLALFFRGVPEWPPLRMVADREGADGHGRVLPDVAMGAGSGVTADRCDHGAGRQGAG